MVEPLIPHVYEGLSRLSSSIGVKLIMAGKEKVIREVLGNILKDELVILVL